MGAQTLTLLPVGDLRLFESVELLSDGVVAVTLREADFCHVRREVSGRVADVHCSLLLVTRQHPHLSQKQKPLLHASFSPTVWRHAPVCLHCAVRRLFLGRHLEVCLLLQSLQSDATHTRRVRTPLKAKKQMEKSK